MAKEHRSRPLERSNIKKLIQQTADLTGLSYSQVEHILWTEFKFVRSVIEEGELRTVYLPRLARFLCKPYRVLKLNEKYKERHGVDPIPVKRPIKELEPRSPGRPITHGRYKNFKAKRNNKWLEECSLEESKN